MYSRTSINLIPNRFTELSDIRWNKRFIQRVCHGNLQRWHTQFEAAIVSVYTFTAWKRSPWAWSERGGRETNSYSYRMPCDIVEKKKDCERINFNIVLLKYTLLKHLNIFPWHSNSKEKQTCPALQGSFFNYQSIDGSNMHLWMYARKSKILVCFLYCTPCFRI